MKRLFCLVLTLVMFAGCSIGAPSDGKKPADKPANLIDGQTSQTQSQPQENEKSPSSATTPQHDLTDGDTNEKTPVNQPSAEKPASGENTPDQNSAEYPVTYDPAKKEEYTYLQYHDMAPEDQQKFVDSFGSLKKFFDWYNAAKEKYEKENPDIYIDNGEINLDEIIK